MTLEEMRRVHEAATSGEWEDDYPSIMTPDGYFRIARVSGSYDAEAIVMYHNKFAKLLAIAEAAKMVRARVTTDTVRTLDEALAALEES